MKEQSTRERAQAVRRNFFLHFHPVKVRKGALHLRYTYGLGGISFLMFIVLVLSGAFLMVYYVPYEAQSYGSTKDIQSAIPFGALFRNAHRWGAHAMVITVFLHLMRVFYTGAYKGERRINWVIGMSLLLMTLALSFTGYLLPWDQLSFWAITVGTNIIAAFPVLGERFRIALLGGETVGQQALIRFYALHIFIIPVVMTVFLGLHFWKVRKTGGISGPLSEGDRKNGVGEAEDVWSYSYPNLVYREMIFGVWALAFLFLFSFFFDAPLEDLADPERTPNPAKAPWYFLGLQELVSWAHPFWGGIFIPGVVFVLLFLLPYIDKNPDGAGVWFSRKRTPEILLFSSAAVFMIVLTAVGTFLRGPGWKLIWP